MENTERPANSTIRTSAQNSNLAETEKENLEAVTQILVRITKRSAEQIRPHLDALLERLRNLEEAPFYETATPEEWEAAFLTWVKSHDQNTLPLFEYAVSLGEL